MDKGTADLAGRLKREAALLGFDAVGITRPGGAPAASDRLRAFLEQGFAGDMDWLARRPEARADPALLWPGVRSVVMLGMSYAPARDPLAGLAERARGVVSVYAKGRDYHDVLKGRLKTLARWLIDQVGAADGLEAKVFVDTAPLMEKPLAQAAGLGWQGKHTNLVSRPHGSWLFLGAILTSVPLEPDAPEADHCGSCRRCLDICPTQAFPAPYQLDARRCIAYLTIEHKGHIRRDLRVAIGNRVFGCDDCLAVCPWNRFAVASREAQFHGGIETDDPPLDELIRLDDAAFRTRFAGTPVKRTGRDRVVRNALIAAGNSDDRALRGVVSDRLDDDSPIVRAMAVWALARLDPEAFAHARDGLAGDEQDAGVGAEWQAGARAGVDGAMEQGDLP